MLVKNQEQFECISLDFSINSALSQMMNALTVEQATQTLFQSVLKNDQIGYGGYLEKRDVYQRSRHFLDEGKNEYRCMHMGIDIWLQEGVEILSPVAGVIHSFANNDNHLDYGNTIILTCADQSYTKHLLFGHLSSDSLKGIEVGQMVQPGAVIAKIGGVSENGGWVPHLHLQCIHDLHGFIGDYPGIALERDLEQFQKNCPDPTPFLF